MSKSKQQSDLLDKKMHKCFLTKFEKVNLDANIKQRTASKNSTSKEDMVNENPHWFGGISISSDKPPIYNYINIFMAANAAIGRKDPAYGKDVVSSISIVWETDGAVTNLTRLSTDEAELAILALRDRGGRGYLHVQFDTPVEKMPLERQLLGRG